MNDNKLTEEQFSICRLKATEPPFTGKYVNCKIDGIEPTGLRYCLNSGALLLKERLESFCEWKPYKASFPRRM